MATLVFRVGELTGYRVDAQWFELQRDQCFYDFEIPYSAKIFIPCRTDRVLWLLEKVIKISQITILTSRQNELIEVKQLSIENNKDSNKMAE